MNSRLVGPDLFHTDRPTEMTKLRVTFLYVSNVPKKVSKINSLMGKQPITNTSVFL